MPYGYDRADAALEEKEALSEMWEKLPDVLDAMSGMVVHEVRCRKCKCHETYIGNRVPTECFICEERRYL